MFTDRDRLCGARDGCTKPASDESHPCPYAQEINDDDSECNCCEDCESECADDI